MSDSVVPKPKKQFTDLPESEQREIILGAVKDSNEEQRKIMDSVLPTSPDDQELLRNNIAAFFCTEQWNEYPVSFLQSQVRKLVDGVEYGVEIPKAGIYRDRFNSIIEALVTTQSKENP